MKQRLLSFIIALIYGIHESSSYKILGLFPYRGKSHMMMFERIMEGLALKGNEVHVLSHYPRESPLANYTDFSLVGSTPSPKDYSWYRKKDILNLNVIAGFYPVILEHENVMKSAAVKRLQQSDERYDLIVTESFAVDSILGFVVKFKAPFVFLSSNAGPPWTNFMMANPQSPAFIPHWLSRFSPKMSFLERIRNTLELFAHLALWYGSFVPANQRIIEKYFGNDMPPLLDIYKNVSLHLTNSHSTITGGRPFAPNVIEVGGVHIRPPQKLPQDIERFIEDSEHGVIYFCLGSRIRAASLPEEKKSAFLRAFSRFKERVLWKFEDENQTVPENVMIKQWMPQRDILAHPKVKLFISHGGLLGLLEAVSEGKPVIGIPNSADQMMNTRSLELQGMAKCVDFHTIDNDTVHLAIQQMLHPKYAERAEELSRLFHDRPMSPLETAVYWIEYVIRNKGARNLRSAAVDLSFYQYLLLDVVVFFISSLVASTVLFYYLIKFSLCSRKRSKDVNGKVKSH